MQLMEAKDAFRIYRLKTQIRYRSPSQKTGGFENQEYPVFGLNKKE